MHHVHFSPDPQLSAHLQALNLAQFILQCSKEAIKARGRFLVAFSGGSLPQVVANGLLSSEELRGELNEQAKHWEIFFCDERMVPLQHQDSNFFTCQQLLFKHLPNLRSSQQLNKGQEKEGDKEELVDNPRVHRINSALSVEEAAKEYESQIWQVWNNNNNNNNNNNQLPPQQQQQPQQEPQQEPQQGQQVQEDEKKKKNPKQEEGERGIEVMIPRFDLLLLGMGPDGHTCSLFPHHPLLQLTLPYHHHSPPPLIAPITDSPKPPAARITMTLPLINSAHHAAFVLSGSGKREVLHAVLGNAPMPNGASYPAKLVQLKQGQVHWFLDHTLLY